MMKMSMADQVKINLNPFQSVIDSLAIDPQRGRQLIHRLSLHGGGDYPSFQKVEGRSLTGRGTLTLMTRHQRPATIGQPAQRRPTSGTLSRWLTHRRVSAKKARPRLTLPAEVKPTTRL